VTRNGRKALAAIALTAGLLTIAAPAGAAQQLENRPIGTLPASCTSAPRGAPCINAVVAALDVARSSLGLGSYVLPANFDSLPGTRQIFILANLDRIALGLPPINGIVAALGGSTHAGVLGDSDPNPASALAGLSSFSWTSNWAGGWFNAPYAYYEWMYDDGYGGAETSNIDCTSATASGCWDHRRNVLAFAQPGTIVMGASVGPDAHGQIGYAMTLVWTPGNSWTSYSYKWGRLQASKQR
jgi:hypothetical protein